MKLEKLASLVNTKGRKPATLAQIEEFERNIGYKLPKDYAHFLTLTVGGQLTPAPFYKLGSLYEGVLCLLGLDDKEKPSPEDSLKEEIKNPGFYPLPSGLLNIGSDTSGNPISICLTEDRFGEIFINDHELFSFDNDLKETIEEAEEYGLAMLVAPSFSSFIEMLALYNKDME
mgnify:CR=1 FL=1